MRVTGPGRVLFGLSFAVLGALCLGFHDFALTWIPKAVAWRDAASVLAGAVMLAGGIGLLVPRTTAPAALMLGALVLLRLVWQLAHVAAHPLVVGEWEDFSESLAEFAGAWTIHAMLPRAGIARFDRVRAGRILFALATPAFGLSHFVYLDLTAPLIPSWIPFHVTLSYFTGAAHLAAGIGILLGLRLAATLEAVMVSLFTLIVWVPAVIAAPASRGNWAEICASAAISGAAWTVSESFGRAHSRLRIR